MDWQVAMKAAKTRPCKDFLLHVHVYNTSLNEGYQWQWLILLVYKEPFNLCIACQLVHGSKPSESESAARGHGCLKLP